MRATNHNRKSQSGILWPGLTPPTWGQKEKPKIRKKKKHAGKTLWVHESKDLLHFRAGSTNDFLHTGGMTAQMIREILREHLHVGDFADTFIQTDSFKHSKTDGGVYRAGRQPAVSK
jgi:hypothetical protein